MLFRDPTSRGPARPRLEALTVAGRPRGGSSPYSALRRQSRIPAPEGFRSRSTLECPPLPFLRDVFTRAHREREDRPCRILVSLRHERAAIGDEEILHVVGTTVCIDSRCCRIVAHADSAKLVDDLATPGDAIALRLRGHGVKDLTAQVGNERSESLLHVANLVVFVVAPLPV